MLPSDLRGYELFKSICIQIQEQAQILLRHEIIKLE